MDLRLSMGIKEGEENGQKRNDEEKRMRNKRMTMMTMKRKKVPATMEVVMVMQRMKRNKRMTIAMMMTMKTKKGPATVKMVMVRMQRMKIRFHQRIRKKLKESLCSMSISGSRSQRTWMDGQSFQFAKGQR